MLIKLFGKNLFEARKSDLYTIPALEKARESKFLPDFYKLDNSVDSALYRLVEMTPTSSVAVPVKKEGEKKEAEKDKVTPRGVYEMKMLHNLAFKINVDPEYVDKQIADFKDKLDLIKSEEYDMRKGVDEISSILLRLENRKSYAKVSKFFEEYPYTATSKIAEVTKAHTHLELGQVAQFLADMPKEATEAMKNYNKGVDTLCGKQAVFYIIADKKDFKKNNARRDPILLAQSPFGHFWQILGAWDKEMMLIEEL